MPDASGPFTVSALDLMGEPISLKRNDLNDAIRKAVEMMSWRLQDVHIRDNRGRTYLPSEFDRLVSSLSKLNRQSPEDGDTH